MMFIRIALLALVALVSTNVVAKEKRTAETKAEKIARHEKLAKEFARTNNFLNTKYPYSYGAPKYHEEKARQMKENR